MSLRNPLSTRSQNDCARRVSKACLSYKAELLGAIDKESPSATHLKRVSRVLRRILDLETYAAVIPAFFRNDRRMDYLEGLLDKGNGYLTKYHCTDYPNELGYHFKARVQNTIAALNPNPPRCAV